MGDFTRFAITSVIAGTVLVGMTVVSCSGGDDSAANAADATADVQHPDAANQDDGSEGDGNTCTPTLPVGWPTWTPPNPINATACTHAQVQSYYDDCTQLGDSPACNSFSGDPTNSPCITCLNSNQGDPTYGPLLTLTNGTGLTNSGGCIALTDGDLSATGCGAQYEAYEFCEYFACSDNCPIDNSSSASQTATYNAFVACSNAAPKSVCKPFPKPTCANDPKYAHCIFANYEAYFVGLSDYFCSSDITDAGADAADGADD